MAWHTHENELELCEFEMLLVTSNCSLHLEKAEGTGRLLTQQVWRNSYSIKKKVKAKYASQIIKETPYASQLIKETQCI